MTPSFHRASGADVEDASALMDVAFDPAFGEAWTRDQLASFLILPGVWLEIARVDGAPAGFALFRALLDEAELLLLAVAPELRRAGLARALIERGCAAASARGVRRMHLEVRETNPAVALYRAAGFRRIGRRPGYYRGRDGSYTDALTLARDLDESMPATNIADE